jgi:hypothetical protein
VLGAAGCGRIGYDLLPEDGRSVPDASRDGTLGTGDGDVDASFSGPDAGLIEDAPSDVTTELAPDVADAGAADLDASDASDANDGAVGCPDGAQPDYCSTLPSMARAPVIDGVLDLSRCVLQDVTPQMWIGPSPLPPFPSGNSSRLAAAWRPDGIYVYVEVTTPAAFPAGLTDPDFFGAGAELFVDDDGAYAAAPTFDNPGTIQIVATSPAVTDAGTPVDGPTQRAERYRNAADQGAWTTSQFGTYPTADGFVLEAFVGAADLDLTTWTLASGSTVGFDIAVDVSYATDAMTGPQGHRVGQYFFHVAPPNDAGLGAPYADPRSWCAPTLQ